MLEQYLKSKKPEYDHNACITLIGAVCKQALTDYCHDQWQLYQMTHKLRKDSTQTRKLLLANLKQIEKFFAGTTIESKFKSYVAEDLQERIKKAAKKTKKSPKPEGIFRKHGILIQNEHK